MEGPLTSDFSAARIHLERAYHYLQGNDEMSRAACEALDLLIEAVTEAQHRRPEAGVLEFPQSTARRTG
ncbi:hypothetical protein [Mesorhizobium sp. M7A.T.Ca.TU.009.02.1.1]|uniref:hypothetical protein n=1 Tax=Mesorhizobium sp. M7A.T.Ca.TU.009.02.1.1 TaxID=2496791 RepID=UPI000FCB312F|nr:hypothetical protein [Mesorhizobium sp. M7A.T.Ca.TU.009.02.1.1]RUT80584.1 hypothetical protein EOD14_33200 [Mesorhizobium sp. M7A.T.Ca.US.000.02.1.1]RUT86997.1 hypothetical protein EOD15_24235 [Mesorhizobium sp. M7A.T.Ca.US.000.02.2.1]RUU56324.1 hypothetical protein EOC99_26770 [Mesorhizobium sp. M7A.T.Ca.TU.009.01.1.1]RUU64196.1 hypothetical protein EOD03_37565 [Mesorhizobium sp. M7A.T.Ca.TU.009.01.1.2]RUU03006.1 hypothetical protein EOD12_11560 [Mesorhizobium sp. M7A.T.Ca.TU.009.02.1.1]